MIRRLGFLNGVSRRPQLLLGTIGLLTLAIIAAAVVWSQQQRPEMELDAAEKDLRQNDPVAARIHLNRCLERWPLDQRALFLSAQAARRSDSYADAERYLTAFEEAAGPTEGSRFEWVLLGAQQGDFEGGEERLRSQVDRRNPNVSAILEALAKGYYVSGRWPDAMMALTQLLDHRSDHVPALVLRGTILDRMRQPEDAEMDFRRAVDLAPKNALAQTMLAQMLARLGLTREAIYHYEMAQLIQPAGPMTLLGWARALSDAAELDQSAKRLDELLDIDQDNVEGLVERGRVAVRQGRFAEAEPYLARAIHLAHWHRDGNQLYLVALNGLGQKEAASQCEARLAAARVEDANGGRLKQIAKEAPRDAEVRWNLWLWCRRTGQGEDGYAWLMNALRIAPDHAQARAALADYFEQQGQPRRATLNRTKAPSP